MAQKAGFITGANAKIKVGSVTMAYATDVSYNVQVQTIPVESIGKYEVHSHEPVAYTVAGSLSVIRYTDRAKTSSIRDASSTGNAPKNIQSTSAGTWQDHINPRDLLASETFDVDVFEKSVDGDKQVIRLTDCRLVSRGSSLNKRGVISDQYSFVAILATDTDIATADQTANSGDEDLSYG